jgi:hypothetical protein
MYLLHKQVHQEVQVVVELVNRVQLVDQEQLVKEMLVVQVMHLKVVQNEALEAEALVVLVSQEHQDLQMEMVEMV